MAAVVALNIAAVTFVTFVVILTFVPDSHRSFGFVFTELVKELKEPWTVTFSHEALASSGLEGEPVPLPTIYDTVVAVHDGLEHDPTAVGMTCSLRRAVATGRTLGGLRENRLAPLGRRQRILRPRRSRQQPEWVDELAGPQ